MNIQIFGKNKCFDTKKSQRWFKERGIKFQMIDLAQKGMSKGELDSVLRAVGGLDALIDEKSRGYGVARVPRLRRGQEGKAARGRHADENAGRAERQTGDGRVLSGGLGEVGMNSRFFFFFTLC